MRNEKAQKQKSVAVGTVCHDRRLEVGGGQRAAVRGRKTEGMGSGFRELKNQTVGRITAVAQRSQRNANMFLFFAERALNKKARFIAFAAHWAGNALSGDYIHMGFLSGAG